MKFKTATKCRCCGSGNLISYLDFGNQPLANSYHKGDVLPEYPLNLQHCGDCFHSQISVVVDPDEMFKHYLYVSGTTKTFRNHCESLAKDAVVRVRKHGAKVLDIACNDGTLLEYFRQEGCQVMGVDPAENLRTLTEEKGIEVKVGYWGSGDVPDQKFDIITATNVFAHVHDTTAFLQDCATVLEDDGMVILEFPYCRELIAHYEFDTVYHEHLSYFLVRPFRQLVERLGLHIVDILRTPIHGGSIRFFIQKKPVVSDKVLSIEQEEEQAGLFDPKTYENFTTQVNKTRDDVRAYLDSTKDFVVGYGASAKGNTMLNYFKINLNYIVDDNPMKCGYLTPGQNILIKPTADLAKHDHPISVLLLAWNFAAEIKKRVGAARPGFTDSFIYYVPKFIIE